MDNCKQKYEALIAQLQSLGSVAVAFSGGVDSTFLLKAAHDALGEQAVAFTAVSPSFPERERTEAESFCKAYGIRQIVLPVTDLQAESFRQNPHDRCYLCKRALFTQFRQRAAEMGINAVCEGSNVDDDGDYRPGMKAVKELQILSPLHDAGLSKQEIRQLSKKQGLPTWDKPSCACLASRFVYGESITEEKLQMVDRAEELLIRLGFRQVRVRIHGTIARIEVLPEQFKLLLGSDVREQIQQTFKALGFSYVTVDLNGYRTGSMNETINR